MEQKRLDEKQRMLYRGQKRLDYEQALQRIREA
jgi:hypothetical protein